MPATRIHLVRHGEVNNPDGVLYGRLPNFPLSDLGQHMAKQAATELKDSGAKITRLIASPLLRTMQSAAPIADQFNLSVETEEQIIEPTNIFEGHWVNLKTIARNPKFLLKLYNPYKPSWGEPFILIQRRMVEAMRRAWDQTPSGEVAMVSHQLPIWMVHRFAQGQRLSHDPRSRRCELSSITSFEFDGENLKEISYKDPAKHLRLAAIDRGAV
jgi:broad specificity phosphatase PhoE